MMLNTWRATKTQTSLRIRAVSSEPWLLIQRGIDVGGGSDRILGAYHKASHQDLDEPAHPCSLVRALASRTEKVWM